jgi:hypothetical protein
VREVCSVAAVALNAIADVVFAPNVSVNVPPPARTTISCCSSTSTPPETTVRTLIETPPSSCVETVTETTPSSVVTTATADPLNSEALKWTLPTSLPSSSAPTRFVASAVSSERSLPVTEAPENVSV